jgi:hypothetical protein
MPDENKDRDKQMAELNKEVQSLKKRMKQVEDQLPPADSAADGEKGKASNDEPSAPPDLKKRWDRHELLVLELEQQSNKGAINLDELMRLYHKEYDRPALMLAQDLQERASVYSNVVEALKREPNVEEAAEALKDRYIALGLIDEEQNQWPNPVTTWLMRFSLDKLSQFRDAMLNLLRTRSRQLLQDLNFDATLTVAFQLSLGTDTSFAITVQPEATIRRAVPPTTP